MAETTTAGRELDALVAEKVMGWVWRRARHAAVKGLLPPTGYDELLSEDVCGDEKLARDFDREVPHYSTDIAAAWEVVGELVAQTDGGRGLTVNISNGPHGWEVTVPDPDYLGYLAEFTENTAPLAICKAALEAVEAYDAR